MRVYWQLVSEGAIYPGRLVVDANVTHYDPNSFLPPYFGVTRYGAEILEWLSKKFQSARRELPDGTALMVTRIYNLARLQRNDSDTPRTSHPTSREWMREAT